MCMLGLRPSCDSSMEMNQSPLADNRHLLYVVP